MADKFDLGSAAINAGSSVANTLITQAFAEHNRKKNFEYNEKAADNADQRQRKQYEELYSPQAMMEQYAAAGLSPSLMMSGGQSAVGQSSAQGNQSAGIQGPYPSATPIDPLAAAQMANIIANTKKTEAETIKIGAETEFTLTNIIKASEETKNIKQTRLLLEMQTAGQELENLGKQLQNEITEESKEDILEQIRIQTEKLQRESEKIEKQNKALDLENQLSEETYTTRVKQFTANYNQTMAATAKAYSDIELNEQQIETLVENVAIAKFNSRTQRLSANAQAKFYQEQVEQWAIENGFTKEQIKNEKWKIAMQTITSIIDSGCKVAGAVLSAK